jgi:N-acetylglucosamine-6-sulfatase
VPRATIQAVKGRTATLALGVVLALACAPVFSPVFAFARAAEPNIVFLFTDDNDTYTLNRAMPNVVNRIGGQGATFENATFAQSLCCPNRASMQRGQYPHNTGVMKNHPPYGGFRVFKNRGHHLDTYATDVKAQGYSTAYVGKYMNGYEDFPGTVPGGWDLWRSGRPMADCFSANGDKRCGDYGPARHDAWVNGTALPWIGAKAAEETPYLAVLSYYNPHAPCEHPSSYDQLFAGERLPPRASFNEADVSDKPAWIRRLPRLTRAEKVALVSANRCRLRSAAFTDDLIGEVLDAVDASGEPTYVVFWNDNGYHLGQHRLQTQDKGGKATPYIEDVRFPLMVRGPDIAPAQKRSELINSVDLRPTLAEMAGGSSPAYADGESFLPLARGLAVPWRAFTYTEAPINTELYSGIPPYKAVYTQTTSYHLWTNSGEQEFYDLLLDPSQLESRPLDSRVRAHKDALSSYSGCAAETCREAGGP